jgi:hypothetical protein
VPYLRTVDWINEQVSFPVWEVERGFELVAQEPFLFGSAAGSPRFRAFFASAANQENGLRWRVITDVVSSLRLLSRSSKPPYSDRFFQSGNSAVGNLEKRQV